MITVSCNVSTNVFSNSSISVVETECMENNNFFFTLSKYKQSNNILNTGFFSRIITWILNILRSRDSNNGGDDNGGGDNRIEPTPPEVSTKGYDIFTNTKGVQMLRFHGILEKTGTNGTNIVNLEFSWTWFEYNINGVIYKTERLMCRGDNLPRVFMYSIPIMGGPDSPEIPSGNYQFKACSENAARLSDYGEWMGFMLK